MTAELTFHNGKVRRNWEGVKKIILPIKNSPAGEARPSDIKNKIYGKKYRKKWSEVHAGGASRA